MNKKKRAGFTILELLVVLAILGLLIGMAAPSAMRQLGSAKNKIAAQSIMRISEALDIYKLDVGSYPTTEQGLQALVKEPSNLVGWVGPYVKPAKVPLDPWNRDFHYRAPSQRDGYEYDLYSLGEDGKDNDEKIMNE